MSPSTNATARLTVFIGISIFVVSILLLLVVLVSRVLHGVGTIELKAVAATTLFALIGVIAMLIDAADLWLRGRRFVPRTVRNLHALVFVAVLAALATSVLGRDFVVVLYLAPSMIIYFFLIRTPQGAPVRSHTAKYSRTAGQPDAAKARQRRGGRKRR